MGLTKGLVFKRDLNTPHDSEQLELALFKGVPWNGVAPRALTRAGSGFILKPSGEEARAIFIDKDQLELWPAKRKRPARAPSAFTLLPLPRRR